MKYYLKASGISFLYIFFSASISISILGIEAKLLGYILLSLSAVVFMFTLSVMGFKNGESAYKVLLLNDIERRIIIETGKDRPINRKEEFSYGKGLMLGLFPSLPLLILLFLHVILYVLGSGYTGIGSLAAFFYKIPYGFFEYAGYDFSMANSFLTLLSVPIIFIPSFIGYLVGARKTRLEQEMIEEHRKFLHGEK